MIARVILNNREHNIDQCFDYLIPDGVKASVGMRVLVPFGYQNRSARGMIVDILSESEFNNLKPVKKIIDSSPRMYNVNILYKEVTLWKLAGHLQ